MGKVYGFSMTCNRVSGAVWVHKLSTIVTPEKKAAFLEHLSKHGCVTAAAKANGFSRWSAYRIKSEDPEFAEAWEDAVQQATDLLLLELRRRAYKGTERPVFYQGTECGRVREYSDSLGMFLVKGVRPEYATERRELSGKDGVPLVPPTIVVNFVKSKEGRPEEE